LIEIFLVTILQNFDCFELILQNQYVYIQERLK